MTMPPDDLSPQDLWAKIMEMPRPHEVIDFPRTDLVTGKPLGKVALWILTQEESMSCIRAAAAFVKDALKDAKPGDAGYADLYRNQSTIEVLSRACRKADNLDHPLFPSPSLMRKKMTSDELGVLMFAYARVQSKLGPLVSELSVEELEAWTARLVTGGEASLSFLDFLTSDAKNQLLEHLALQLQISSTSTGSPGSPQDDTSIESSPLPAEASDPLPGDVNDPSTTPSTEA
jgi:hypothetical protein